MLSCRRFVRFAAVTVLAVMCIVVDTGCSSVMSSRNSGPEPALYGGTLADYQLGSGEEFYSTPARTYAWLDLPLSFTVDTILFPFQMIRFLWSIPGQGMAHELDPSI